MKRLLRRRCLTGACLALMAVLQATSAMAGVVPRVLYDKAAREGPVRVIVQFRVPMTPEGDLQNADAVAFQRQAIAALRSAALTKLAGTGHRTIREFTTIPFVALEVAPDAISALEASPDIVGVEEDRLENVALSQSVPLIGANQAWAAGADGTGSVVAILDTGVDKTHPFLSGKVVREACFSANGSCPNGQTSQIGSGAGVPCAYAPNGCRHGTHVAGIVAGSGVSFSGVAKGARIIAVQVFSRLTGALCAGGEDPCALAAVSDLIAGLEHIYSLRSQFAIAAVNLSLGGATRFTAPCDSGEAARKAVIDNLRSVGIATIAASGNGGFSDGLGAPACISTAVSVGSTTKSDVVSSFSNSAPFLSLLAPGESMTSSVPGGGFAVFSGTSQAAPHVAGAWAILKQKKPNATVTELLTALRNTGLLITDPRNNVTTPRIQVNQALQAVTTSHSLTITSGPGGSPNPVASGGTVGVSASAGDSLGHALNYAWTVSCPILGFSGSFNNPTLQTPTWTAPANLTGIQQSCNIQVRVNDGQGLNQIGSYPQTVNSVSPLTVLTAGAGTGSVTSNVGGINCAANAGTCAALLATGTGITLTATATGGSTFAGWGRDCAALGTASACSLIMNGTKTVSAAFNPPSPPPSALATGRQLLPVMTRSGPGGSEQRTFLTTDPIAAEAGYYDSAEACAGVAPTKLQFFVFNLDGQLILGRNRDIPPGGVTSAPVAVGSKSQLLRADLEAGALPSGDYNLVFRVEDCTAASVLVSEFYAIQVLAP